MSYLPEATERMVPDKIQKAILTGCITFESRRQRYTRRHQTRIRILTHTGVPTAVEFFQCRNIFINTAVFCNYQFVNIILTGYPVWIFHPVCRYKLTLIT